MSINENLDTDSLFYQKVEDNHDVCTNCYRKLSYKLYPHETLPGCVTPRKEYEEHVNFDYFDDEDKSGRPSIHRAFCECGFVDSGKLRPLDSKELIEVADRVLERLEEQEYELDEDTYFATVRREKSNPDSQFNEEAILESAVEEAVITNEET